MVKVLRFSSNESARPYGWLWALAVVVWVVLGARGLSQVQPDLLLARWHQYLGTEQHRPAFEQDLAIPAYSRDPYLQMLVLSGNASVSVSGREIWSCHLQGVRDADCLPGLHTLSLDADSTATYHLRVEPNRFGLVDVRDARITDAENALSPWTLLGGELLRHAPVVLWLFSLLAFGYAITYVRIRERWNALHWFTLTTLFFSFGIAQGAFPDVFALHDNWLALTHVGRLGGYIFSLLCAAAYLGIISPFKISAGLTVLALGTWWRLSTGSQTVEIFNYWAVLAMAGYGMLSGMVSVARRGHISVPQLMALFPFGVTLALGAHDDLLMLGFESVLPYGLNAYSYMLIFGAFFLAHWFYRRALIQADEEEPDVGRFGAGSLERALAHADARVKALESWQKFYVEKTPVGAFVLVQGQHELEVKYCNPLAQPIFHGEPQMARLADFVKKLTPGDGLRVIDFLEAENGDNVFEAEVSLKLSPNHVETESYILRMAKSNTDRGQLRIDGVLLNISDMRNAERARYEHLVAAQSQELAGLKINERELLARDLHDGLAPSLVMAHLMCEQPHADLRKISEALEDCVAELYAIVDMPPADDVFLSDVVVQLVYRMERRSKTTAFEVVWDIDVSACPAVSSHWALDVVRVLQELMVNAMRHSGGSLLTVSAHYASQPPRVVLQVSDNGDWHEQGDDVLKGRDSQIQRTQRLGAQVSVSATERGASVWVVVPVNAGPTVIHQ